MANVWARKSTAALADEVAQGEGDVHAPKRSLSALNLVGLGVGGIIGAGIFVLTGHAAAANAGPAVTLSFLLGAVACAFAGLCYAELSSTIPISGSAYTYAYATLGELIAWIIGWDLILEYAVGAITVAIGWSGYVVSFAKDVGVALPGRWVSSPFAFDATRHAWSSTGAILNIPAVLIVLAVTALLTVGIQESSRFNNVIVVVKLTVIALFIVCTIPAFSTANWVTSDNPAGHSSRRMRASGHSAGRAWSAARPWSFSPISALTRSPPRRRRQRRRCGTCPSASSVRWPSARFSTLRSASS